MEIIDTILHYASIIAMVMFLLVFAVNIIVEVVKRIVPKAPADIVVLVLSILLTVLSLYIYAQISGIVIMWYYAVGAVVLGIFVAHCAMFGFDKFTELLRQLKQMKAGHLEDLAERE